MTAAEITFCTEGFKVSTTGVSIYAASLRDSANVFAQHNDAKAAALAELLRQTAQEMDKAIKTFHQNLTEFSNGQRHL